MWDWISAILRTPYGVHPQQLPRMYDRYIPNLQNTRADHKNAKQAVRSDPMRLLRISFAFDGSLMRNYHTLIQTVGSVCMHVYVCTATTTSTVWVWELLIRKSSDSSSIRVYSFTSLTM